MILDGGMTFKLGLKANSSLCALEYPQLRMRNADMKSKRSYSFIHRLWLWGDLRRCKMKWRLPLPQCLRGQRLLCFDLCNDPSCKAVFRDKKPRLVWPLSSLVFSALVGSCGEFLWRQFRVVGADSKCGANFNGHRLSTMLRVRGYKGKVRSQLIGRTSPSLG